MSAGLFTLLAVLSLLLIVGAVVLLLVLFQRSSGQKRLQQRIEPEVARVDEFEAPGGDSALLRKISRGGKAIEGWVDAENESARLLLQAGWRSDQARALWYALQAAMPLLGAFAVGLFWAFGPDKNKPVFLLMYGFAAFALSVLIPRWILRAAASGRRARIKAEIPLFIHLLVLLFEAGLSLRQAFASLVREGGGVLQELGREFELVLRQLEAGADTAEVLKLLSDTLEVDDLSSVLAVLRQVDRYGGEVREPLLETLGVLEERRGLDLRERVNLLSGRMTVVMVLFFFPALLIFVAGPAFTSIIKALNGIAAH